MIIDANGIEEVAKDVLRWPETRKWRAADKDRRFKALFGASSAVVATLWNMLFEREVQGEPKHLLWTLVHLKVYGSEEVNCAIVGWPSVKTYSKWVWYYVEQIAGLKDNVINIENRFDGLDGVATSNAFISVDGTDCPVFEPSPFSTKMFSKKLNGPGVKYEVGVCIKTGMIVWVNGPHIASKHDNTIIKEELLQLLFPDEAIECDRGYGGDDRLKTPTVASDSKERKMKSNVRAQQEAVNARLKVFNVLTTHFRHMKPDRAGMMEKHGWCFHAIAVITQLKFMGGERVFDESPEFDVSYL